MAEASLDDYNATPMGKLPPPVMQSKQSMPPIDAPNYRDLLKEMDHAHVQPAPATKEYATQSTYLAQQPPPAAMPQMPAQMPPQMQPQVQPQMLPQVQAHPQAARTPYASSQPPQYQAGAHEGYYGSNNDDYYNAEYEDYAAEAQPEGAQKRSLLSRLVASHKPTLVVIAAVFLVLFFIVPRLARMPRFATFDGHLNLLGKMAAAAAAGGAYHVSLLVV